MKLHNATYCRMRIQYKLRSTKGPPRGQYGEEGRHRRSSIDDVKCRLGSLRIQRSVKVAASNSSSDSEQQSCCGKYKPMDSIYRYTSTPGENNWYNKKRAMRSFG